MTNIHASGIEPGQRRLNGPQTTGREYRNLSQPTHSMVEEHDIPATHAGWSQSSRRCVSSKRSGTLAGLNRGLTIPRQIQDMGAPAGFIEAGASDFFVPRGYVHLIANLGGTGGSGGTYTYSDSLERRDMHDLGEWVAQQPWCDGNVGMIGISYFAGTQMAAAVERPPHLKAIMPIQGTYDFYQS